MCLHLRRWFLSSVLVNRKKNIMSLPELSLFSRHRLQPLWFLPYANRADRLPKHDCVVPHRPLLFSNPYKTAWHQTTFSIQCWEKKKRKKITDIFHRTGCTLSLSISLSKAFLKVNWCLKLSMFDTSQLDFLSGFSVLGSASCIWCTHTGVK